MVIRLSYKMVSSALIDAASLLATPTTPNAMSCLLKMHFVFDNVTRLHRIIVYNVITISDLAKNTFNVLKCDTLEINVIF